MKVGAQELGHKVSRMKIGLGSRSARKYSIPYMSSRGEMKISLKLITFENFSSSLVVLQIQSYVLVTEMFQEFEFSVSTLREDRSAERLHDLFHRDGLACELILCGTVHMFSAGGANSNHDRDSYQTSPKAPIPTGCKSVYLLDCQHQPIA